MERRTSSRLAEKRKHDENVESKSLLEEGDVEEEEEEDVGKKKRGRGGGRGRGSRGRGRGSRGGRGRGGGGRGKKKKGTEEEEEEGQEEGEGGPAKKQKTEERTPSQDATGIKEHRKGDEEEQEGVHTDEEGEGDIETAEEVEERDLEMKARGVRFLEKGHIYFFYRPKVELEESHNLREVQRLFILLSTKRTHESPHEERSHRLIAIPKKTLPSIDSKERRWGIVTKVTHHVKDVHDFLQEEHYHTATLGEREVEAARPAGEGYYSIIDHNGHTHLAYVLEQPEELGDVQKAFNIVKEGSFIIHVKNPAVTSMRSAFQGPGKADFPSELSDIFRRRRWAPVNPPTFLNYENAELLLIGASEEFGRKGQQLEQEEAKDIKQHKHLFQELRLSTEEFPPDPLLKGKWA